MTEREHDQLTAMSRDIRTLTDAVSSLNTTIVRHMASEESVVASLKVEVFGVDGDPAKSGLKGRTQKLETEVDRISKTSRSASRRVWECVALGIAAAFGWLAQLFARGG